jgi:hypothetical protein
MSFISLRTTSGSSSLDGKELSCPEVFSAGWLTSACSGFGSGTTTAGSSIFFASIGFFFF